MVSLLQAVSQNVAGPVPASFVELQEAIRAINKQVQKKGNNVFMTIGLVGSKNNQ